MNKEQEAVEVEHREEADVRRQVYKEFELNCTDYMIRIYMSDSLIT